MRSRVIWVRRRVAHSKQCWQFESFVLIRIDVIKFWMDVSFLQTFVFYWRGLWSRSSGMLFRPPHDKCHPKHRKKRAIKTKPIKSKNEEIIWWHGSHICHVNLKINRFFLSKAADGRSMEIITHSMAESFAPFMSSVIIVFVSFFMRFRTRKYFWIYSNVMKMWANYYRDPPSQTLKLCSVLSAAIIQNAELCVCVCERVWACVRDVRNTQKRN